MAYALHLPGGKSDEGMPPDSREFEKRYALTNEDVEALAHANDSGEATFKDIAKWITKGAIPEEHYSVRSRHD
jgi:hypothetical protein